MNLSDAVAAYLADRAARGITRNSIRNERGVLQYLLADVGNIQIHRIRPQHLDIFWSKRTTWGPGTMNRARTHLSTFFAWCRARGYMQTDNDPLLGSRKIRVPPRDRIIIPQEEFQTFIEGIEDPRSRICVALGLYLFVRVSEIEVLRWQDLNLQTSVAQVFRPKTVTLDDLPICEELDKEIRRWRLAYANKVGEAPKPGWFLVPALPNGGNRKGLKGKKGFQVTEEMPYLVTKRSNVAYAMRTELERAGYYKPYEGGHTLRRSGAIALYNELSSVGHDRAIRICQAMLGHSSVQTTEIYLRLDLDRKVRNDLLAGRPMFTTRADAGVIPLHREAQAADGRKDAQSVRM